MKRLQLENMTPEDLVIPTKVHNSPFPLSYVDVLSELAKEIVRDGEVQVVYGKADRWMLGTFRGFCRKYNIVALEVKQ